MKHITDTPTKVPEFKKFADLESQIKTNYIDLVFICSKTLYHLEKLNNELEEKITPLSHFEFSECFKKIIVICKALDKINKEFKITETVLEQYELKEYFSLCRKITLHLENVCQQNEELSDADPVIIYYSIFINFVNNELIENIFNQLEASQYLPQSDSKTISQPSRSDSGMNLRVWRPGLYHNNIEINPIGIDKFFNGMIESFNRFKEEFLLFKTLPSTTPNKYFGLYLYNPEEARNLNIIHFKFFKEIFVLITQQEKIFTLKFEDIKKKYDQAKLQSDDKKMVRIEIEINRLTDFVKRMFSTEISGQFLQAINKWKKSHTFPKRTDINSNLNYPVSEEKDISRHRSMIQKLTRLVENCDFHAIFKAMPISEEAYEGTDLDENDPIVREAIALSYELNTPQIKRHSNNRNILLPPQHSQLHTSSSGDQKSDKSNDFRGPGG